MSQSTPHIIVLVFLEFLNLGLIVPGENVRSLLVNSLVTYEATSHGFSIMKRYEGPSTAFDMLACRFPEAPGMVVYDNACNLSRYALKREPGFFAKTRFRIDRVHQAGHVGCHEGYSLTSYPDNCPVLSGSMRLHAMNSQVCEQANSSLESISTQAKFMTQDHFLQYVRYFLYRLNMVKIRTLDEPGRWS